jgi:hypothetical protein
VSTPKHGSRAGTQEKSIPIGYNELVTLRRELFGLASTLAEMRARIHSAEQTVASLASYAEDLMKETALSTSTPVVSMSASSSSTTPLKRAEPSSYVRGHWTQSPSGEWEYRRSRSMAPSFQKSRSSSSTPATPTPSSPPSTTTRLDGEPTYRSDERLGIEWWRNFLGRSPGARM